MRKVLFTLILVSVWFEVFGYKISGQIKGYSGSEFDGNVYLCRYPNIKFNSISNSYIINSAKVGPKGNYTIQGSELLNVDKAEGKSGSPDWGTQKEAICKLYVVPKGKPKAYATGRNEYGIFLLLEQDTELRLNTSIQNFGNYSLIEGNEANRTLTKLRHDVVGPLYDFMDEVEREMDQIKAQSLPKDSITQFKKQQRVKLWNLVLNLKPEVKHFIDTVHNPWVKVFALSMYMNYGDLLKKENTFCQNLVKEFRRPYSKGLYFKKLKKLLAKQLVDYNRFQAASKKALGRYEILNRNGESVELSNFKGKYVLLDFWASWCKPCIKGFDEVLKPLYQKYQNNKFEIVGINVDEDREEWLQALKKLDLPWKQVRAKEENIMRDFNVSGLPHYALIDKQGKVLRSGINSAQLRLYLRDSLGLDKENPDFVKYSEDTATVVVTHQFTKKKVNKVKRFLNNKGVILKKWEPNFEDGSINKMEASLRCKSNDYNTTFTVPRLKYFSIRFVEYDNGSKDLGIKTESKNIFGN